MADMKFTDQFELDDLLDVLRELARSRAPDVGFLIVAVGPPRPDGDGVHQSFSLRTNANSLAAATTLVAHALNSLAQSEVNPMIVSPHERQN